MTEDHPAVRRHKILAVVLHDRRRRALLIEHEHLCRQPFAVETIANRECAQARDDDPERADLFPTRSRQDRQRAHAERGHRKPQQLFPPAHRLILVEIAARR